MELERQLSHLILQNKDVVVMDMEAGIEHLGRGTAQGVDAFIVVVEPGERSIQTYRKVKQLGFVYYSQDVVDSDRSNRSPYDINSNAKNQIRAIKDRLIQL